MNRIFLVFTTLLIIPLYANIARSKDIGLILKSEKHRYVLREPVKFYLSFQNITDSNAYIFDYTKSGYESSSIQIEVKYPSGKIERRSWLGVTGGHYFGLSYCGITFPPGEMIQLCFYPNGTQVWEGDRYSSDYTPTFPEVGEYTIRYIFCTPDETLIYSNAIIIEIVSQSPDEKEILDAYWASNNVGGHALSHSSCLCCNNYDRDALQRVIEKYPDHEMIKYAMYGLALSWGCGRDGRDELAGLRIFDNLLEKYPDFYFFEINRTKLRLMMTTDQCEEAQILYKRMLIQNSHLANIHAFVVYMDFIERCILYGRIETGKRPVVDEWRELIKNGKREEFIHKYSHE